MRIKCLGILVEILVITISNNMLVSYKWLQEYFDHDLPKLEELVDLITVKSFEIEGVENGDVIDIDILPNRAHDCLSHYGIAREISSITDLKLKEIDIVEKPYDFETEFSIDVQSPSCRRYMLREVKNVHIGESPEELKEKLEAIGQKSINTIVDITNIVMFELGQPMHAFDTDKIDGNVISIRQAKKGEEITTLDKKEVKLDEDILLIADGTGPLAIAGIKGGNKAEVNNETKNIVLESANFHPTEVRKTSRRIKILTDSSKRFENEITPYLVERAMDRAVDLILQYAATDKTSFSEKKDYYPRPIRSYRTGVSLSEINSLLGVNFEEKEVSMAFDKLYFKHEIVNPREKVIEEVTILIDRPYKLGASVLFDAPNIFDCSSLVSYVYSLAGFSIPRVSVDQYVYGEEVSKKDLQPGDLIFSNTGVGKIHTETIEFLPGTEVPEGVDHVGIYIGDEKVIHATESGAGTVIEEGLNNSERFKNIVGYRRIINSDESRFAVESTPERLDIKTSADLIEEAGRIIGYDRIIEEKIEMEGFSPEINKEYYISGIVRNTLAGIGFSEIISYTFVNEGEIEPEKPIAEDKGFLRSSLLIGLETAFEKNINNLDLLGLDKVQIFEIGHVFDKSGEKIMLSIGVRNKPGVKKPKASEVIKEAVDMLSEKLGVSIEIDIKDDTEKIEINLDELMEQINISDTYPGLPEKDDISYKPFSSYPFILRDIAVFVPNSFSEEDVLKIITDNAGDLLVNHNLFDKYEKDGRVSYAYHLVFQSYEKTLTDDEINPIMDKITEIMNGNDNWEVR